ncbi:hypothetical protein CBR_g38278 [Chara braunii]|uniref:P-type ATPase C-terminal domain-containing protein n=1 Tax=Chara braunii TaxID=69332 RepID=A0A388LPQ0_CHABU|nr:hypothetical protein CBR_g38278 [Chara braunii]|eukprot:GBG84308.1 hypothetical protein CBR_g38278 [Chara braunii]
MCSWQVSYFFYKNLAFGLTVFYFNSNALFSGQSIFEEWAMALYNVIFTSIPVMVVGIFEQDVAADTCLKFPALYRQGPGNAFFSWGRIFLWMALGVYNSIVLFFLVAIAFSFGAFRSDGKVADMWAVGTSMYTCIIWTVTVQLALSISYFTWVHHVALWGSIACWYVYLAVRGMMNLDSNMLKGVLSEELAPSPTFWLLTIVIPMVGVFPSFLYTAFVRQFRPSDHHIIGEIVNLELQKKDPAMWKREQRKAHHRPKFGFTAAVDAAVRRMRAKGHRGSPTPV